MLPGLDRAARIRYQEGRYRRVLQIGDVPASGSRSAVALNRPARRRGEWSGPEYEPAHADGCKVNRSAVRLAVHGSRGSGNESPHWGAGTFMRPRER